MKLALALASALVTLPLVADEDKAGETKKSGCQVGEGMPKFSVSPVTGRFAKRKSVCYI